MGAQESTPKIEHLGSASAPKLREVRDSQKFEVDTEFRPTPAPPSEGDGRAAIVKRDIALPAPFTGRLAFVLDNVFTKEECEDLIAQTEARTYKPALINMGGGREVYVPEARNNDRCMIDSFEQGNEIFRRIAEFVPKEWTMGTPGKHTRTYKAVTVNERMRFLRYIKGQKFEPHFDGCYARENGERSFITVQLYLNEGMTGGSTRFLDESETKFADVNPKTGSVLVFQHDILHAGMEVLDGVKYVVRSDIMYAPVEQAAQDD